MENNNTNNMNNQTCDLKSYMQGKRKKRNRILFGAFVGILALVLGFTTYMNPNLFGASLTEGTETGGLTDTLYIPNYTGSPDDEGNISIKTKDDIAQFDAITFTLHYSPVNALIFDTNPIVLDSELSNTALQLTSEPEDGSLSVIMVLEDATTITGITNGLPATYKTLFKLATHINPDLPIGQEVSLSVDGVGVLNGASVLTALDAIVAGTITLSGQAELKVLNAESIDANHVAVQFSDYLSNIGSTASYTIADTVPASLSVTNVQLGSDFGGYDQKTVILTTATQDPAEEYSLAVASPVAGNTHLGLKTNFENAIFFGYGQPDTSLSDFGMVSASVSNYNTVTATFSDSVSASSVTKDDFTLTLLPSTPITISNVSSVSGNQVTLVVNTPLLKKNNYLLAAVSQNSVLRDSDDASLGIDRVAFNGEKNGPAISSAIVSEPTSGVYKLTVNFDENIQVTNAATTGEIGRLENVNGGLPTDLIDNTADNYLVSTSSVSFSHADLGTSTSNFIFSSSAAWITNSIGVPVDSENIAVSVWGYGHSISTNNIGSATVTSKDIIVIGQGTGVSRLNFSEVATTDVIVSKSDLSLVTKKTVEEVDGDLQIEMNAPLEPNTNYIVRIRDSVVSATTLAVAEVTVGQDLDVTSASSVSSTSVRVNFSENIDERNLDSTDFSIYDYSLPGAIAVSAVSIDAGYQSVTLTTAALTAGHVYTVTANDGTPAYSDDIYAYDGSAMGKNTAAFGGYGTSAALSDLVLTSIQVISGTSLRLSFSGSVDPDTVTPINVRISDTTTELTVSEVTQVSAGVYDLTTAKQTANTNYFVILEGVKDTYGLDLGNVKVLNFFGFQLPSASVSTVVPNSLTNDEDGIIILAGQNLDIIDSALIGTEDVVITNQLASSITIAVPAGFEEGVYDITLVDDEGVASVLPSAFLVTVPATPLTVVSAQSKAVPYNMPNDGTTETTLWVLIEDPVSIANVSSVVIDLSQIGGMGTVEMQKDDGTQPQYGQWYTHEITIPNTVATLATPYLLPVQARKGSEVAEGTLSIMVTGDVYKSVAPTIDQIYVSPLSVSPDSETPVKISAQISDVDGAETIISVVADLGSLGIGFVPLSSIETGEGMELTTRYFQSEEFIIPDTVATGTYTINVTALDDTGESVSKSLSLIVSTELTGPNISATKSYVSPRQSIPNDETTTFSIHAYVSDSDGVGDITSVTASFGVIGLPPVSFVRSADVSEDAKSAWYSVEGLTIPKTAPIGVHQIEVEAMDTSGGASNLIIQIDVTYKDTLGDPPIVIEDRGYTNPTVAINDGETTHTLYAFVRDDDDDIESVIVNLSSIGQVGPEGVSDFVETDSFSSDTSSTVSGSCPTGSNVLVCMIPSVSEGNDGQWFILPGVTISSTTMPSTEPYEIDIIASDATGKTNRGVLPIYIHDGESFTNDRNPPELVVAVASSSTTVEVQFNEEIQADSISSRGREFTITDKDDVSKELMIVGATINAVGTIVTLSTENQIAGKEYVVHASSDIKDALGVSLVAGSENRKFFNGFRESGDSPIVEYISATDIDTVEIEFRDNLLPSSLILNAVTTDQEPQEATLRGRALNVEIYESGLTSEELEVLDVRFGDAANIIEVKTATQKPGQRYRIMLKGLTSFDGTEPAVTINRMFKGYDIQTVQRQAASNLADLNNDGKVDFLDFTIFSSVYGTSYINSTATELEMITEGNGLPIPDEPDSLVPHTSEPAGGEVEEALEEIEFASGITVE